MARVPDVTFEKATPETAELYVLVDSLATSVAELTSKLEELAERIDGIATTNNLWDGS